ncbi:MAG TPA: DUF4412 domain-containing protein [Ignavibacteriaceae bacterium]|nr:DUF4412 domain-containing protein [Ignavibacteriaceae bacterium]
MSLRFAAACLAVLFLSVFQANSFCQPTFEGKISGKITGENKEIHNFDYIVKGDKIRMNFNLDNEKGDQQMGMIMDIPNKKTYMIMPSQKMYMEYPYQELSKETKEKIDEKWGKMSWTDETKMINGYKCQKITYSKEDEGSGEIWVTKDLGKLTFFGSQMGKSEAPEWLPEFMKEGNFPMLGIQKDESGNETLRWEIVKIEKQPVSDDTFTPPSDFQKMSMPGMNFNK